MKMKEKNIILIILLIGVIVIAGIYTVKNNKKAKEQQPQEQYIEKEEFVQILGDGTKLNISNKLKGIKTFDGLEISNFQLTQKDNITVLLGTITNKSNVIKGDYSINIKIFDKEGKEIVTVGGYIAQLQPGERAQLNSSATFDYANAYDFEITKK